MPTKVTTAAAKTSQRRPPSVAAFAPPFPVDRAFRRTLTPLGKGNFMFVWGNAEWVLKEPSFLRRAGYTADQVASVRRAVSLECAQLMNMLRTDPALRDTFGDIFPTTFVSPDGFLIQARAKGVPMSTLPQDHALGAAGGSLSWAAHNDIDKVRVAVAARLSGAPGFDNNNDAKADNLLFDPKTGKVTAAFDPFVSRLQVAHKAAVAAFWKDLSWADQDAIVEADPETERFLAALSKQRLAALGR